MRMPKGRSSSRQNIIYISALNIYTSVSIVSTSGWAHFWENEKHSFNTVMKIATTYFASEIEKKFQLNSTSKILDYGCGPGFLIDYLATKEISITGADINQFYIEECKKNHPQSLFIHIATDPELTKLTLDDRLKKKFDFIILLSISQYFESTEKLDTVIKMLLSYINENGKIIIADVIDDHTSSISDAGSLFFHCMKKNELMAFFRFISYLFFSNYRKISVNSHLLKISEQSIHQIASDNFLDYENINGLTIHSSRTSYILSKKHI